MASQNPGASAYDRGRCAYLCDLETTQGQALGDFSIIAGDAAGEDIRAEMALLRAELDMLKRSFRRHCRETA